MHDQKKKEREVLSPEQVAAAAAEHERVGVLYKAVLHTSTTHAYSAQTLEQTEKLLLAVPEAYTAYNCRRRALETVWADMKPCQEDASTTDAPAPALTKQEWLRKELKLNSTVLLMNYKNYNAFVHRHWVFDQLEALAKAELTQHAQQEASTPTECSASAMDTAPTFLLLRQLLRKEMAQCEQLLQMDERNFHAWNYRRWVLAQEHRAEALARAYLPPSSPSAPAAAAETRSSVGATDAEAAPSAAAMSFSPDEASELAYTTLRIRNNFSNYSAWHQRSLALKSAVARWQHDLAHVAKNLAPAEVEKKRAACHAALLAQLREDVGFLAQAIYCDPNDQSAWFYAPFALQLLQDVRHSSTAAEGGAEAAELTETLVNSVIELVAEVDGEGREDECYMPYYFLLDRLLALQAASSDEEQAAVTRYTNALCEKVASLAAAADEEESRWQSCTRFLHQRLCQADTLRKGLYDDMLRMAAKATA